MPDVLDLRLLNDLQEIPRLATRIEAYVEGHDLPPQIAFHFNLALDELLTNVISYGFDDGGQHEISVKLWIEDGIISAELTDDGAPFDPFKEARPPVLEGSAEDRPIGGLGIHFVKTLMDGVRYERVDAHNRLVMFKRVK